MALNAPSTNRLESRPLPAADGLRAPTATTERAASTRPSAGSRLGGIEALRAFAALTVLAHHTLIYVPASDGGAADLSERGYQVLSLLGYGLTLFFALSGFLLFLPFAKSIVRGRPLPDVRAYGRNRLLRIIPLYWAVLLVTALVLTAAVVNVPRDFGALTDPGTLLANLLLLQGFMPDTVGTGIGPAWSLAVEMVFYLVLPLLAFAAMRGARRARTLRGRVVAACVPALALLVVGVVCKRVFDGLYDELSPLSGAVLRLSFPAQADQFAFGMLAAVAYVLAADGRLATGRWHRIAAGAGALAVLAVTLRGHTTHVHASPEHTWVALACALGLWAIVMPPGPRERVGVVRRLLETRVLVVGGLVSYGVYLWHTPVLIVLERWGLHADDTMGIVQAIVVAVAVVGPLSWLTYRFVEVPALARKRPMTRPAPETAIAAPVAHEPAPARA